MKNYNFRHLAIYFVSIIFITSFYFIKLANASQFGGAMYPGTLVPVNYDAYGFGSYGYPDPFVNGIP